MGALFRMSLKRNVQLFKTALQECNTHDTVKIYWKWTGLRWEFLVWSPAVAEQRLRGRSSGWRDLQKQTPLHSSMNSENTELSKHHPRSLPNPVSSLIHPVQKQIKLSRSEAMPQYIINILGTQFYIHYTSTIFPWRKDFPSIHLRLPGLH